MDLLKLGHRSHELLLEVMVIGLSLLLINHFGLINQFGL